MFPPACPGETAVAPVVPVLQAGAPRCDLPGPTVAARGGGGEGAARPPCQHAAAHDPRVHEHRRGIPELITGGCEQRYAGDEPPQLVPVVHVLCLHYERNLPTPLSRAPCYRPFGRGAHRDARPRGRLLRGRHAESTAHPPRRAGGRRRVRRALGAGAGRAPRGHAALVICESQLAPAAGRGGKAALCPRGRSAPGVHGRVVPRRCRGRGRTHDP
mmetsp:Transcript_20584/g.55490  ORF Transcript_20584/g.55490 Transcript_20584/m.55490 type:complete len:215 (+) Transcript_20584:339-983(+)